MTKELNECAVACSDTHKTALETMRYCLITGGRHARNGQLLRLLDCARLCGTAEAACLSDAADAARAAEACAKACERSAADCGRFEEPEMRQCAEVCLYCAHACYRVVHAVPA
jgi:hypothetical protein